MSELLHVTVSDCHSHAEQTNGLNTKGYYGAVADGCYIAFMPRRFFLGTVKLARVSDCARDSELDKNAK